MFHRQLLDLAIVPEGRLIYRSDRTITLGRSLEELLLHGQHQMVLRHGDNFHGLFSKFRAPYDWMLSLLSPKELAQRSTFHHTLTPTEQWTSCTALLTGLKPYGQRLLLLWPGILNIQRSWISQFGKCRLLEIFSAKALPSHINEILPQFIKSN